MTGASRIPPRGAALRAVALREFAAYFGNPTGYVFITIFVFLSAIAAFWQEAFFLNNLANLDQLNRLFPYLLVFLVPSITMGLWADERRQGTEELLLTLPARPWELVLGKYLAALAIYTVALVFSLSHAVVLSWLGNPDPGLIFSTYFGYWLMGAALLPLGLLASQWTENLTVAFILGALFCAFPVFLANASILLGGGAARLAERFSAPSQFRDLSQGVFTPQSLTYFVALACAGLSVCISLAGRRRWPLTKGAPPMRLHAAVRALSAFVIAGALTSLAGGIASRIDVTSEKIHSLSAGTRRLIAGIDPKRPVFIQAYFSPTVPRAYIEARNNLVAFLREFEAVSGGRIQARIVETHKYSPEAREARERYGINAFRVPAAEEGGAAVNEIFLGLVFTCGSEEFVIPSFDRGLPVEYELMRSIRVVSRAQRKKIGILDAGARLFGGFDFQAKTQSNEWAIVAELRKQYEVERVSPDTDYPGLDALLVVQPTALTSAQLERLSGRIAAGLPALVLLDPMPAFNLNLSPAARSAGMAAESAAPAADITPLLKVLGVNWRSDQIVWDTWNPHPSLRNLPPEIVFVGKGSKAAMPFQEKDHVTAGLQEMVLLYPGALKPRTEPGVRFTPLLEAGKDSGTVRWSQLVQPSLFGGFSVVRGLPHNPGNEVLTLAARVRGEGGSKANAIVVADADLIGEEFFEIRRRGIEGLSFDNVTFVLNAIDDLAGDPSFIALRKRRPRHRTLELIEARTRTYEQKRREESEQAAAVAEQRLREAQARLDAAVKAIEARTDLDEQTRQIMISNVQSAEQRRLAVARANIEDERQRQIENARISMESSVRGIQNTIKLLAISLPPIPAFVLAVAMSLRRLRRERARIAPERLVDPAADRPAAGEEAEQ
jgi:ABC-2 type transport system permease protein